MHLWLKKPVTQFLYKLVQVIRLRRGRLAEIGRKWTISRLLEKQRRCPTWTKAKSTSFAWQRSLALESANTVSTRLRSKSAKRKVSILTLVLDTAGDRLQRRILALRISQSLIFFQSVIFWSGLSNRNHYGVHWIAVDRKIVVVWW